MLVLGSVGLGFWFGYGFCSLLRFPCVSICNACLLTLGLLINFFWIDLHVS